jgi:hypothetical protein
MCPNKKMTWIEVLPDTWDRSQTLQEQLAVGRADLVLIAAHDMLSSTNSPLNYQGPFWLPVIDWGYDLKKKWGGVPTRQRWHKLHIEY